MHGLTQSAILQALGWTLVNSLWQMGLLWLTGWLLTRLFHHAPSRFRYGLALALLGFGALGSVITFVARYFFDDGDWGMVSAGNWTGGSQAMAMILPYCSSLYLLILGALLIRYSHQYIHSRRLARIDLSRLPAGFRVFVASTSRLMGIRPEVKAWLSTRVDVPLTLGWLKPVILLPAAMISNLSPQQVEAILIHELAHIRRRDYLVNLAVTVIGLLFFFNPFSRLLIRQLQKEREHCCDDEVLQFRYDPHAYVSALLSLARQHRQGRLALAATGGDDQLLLQRARKILQQKRTDRRPGARSIILLLLAAAMAVLSLSTPPRQQPTAREAQQPAAVPLPGEMVFVPIVNSGAPGTRPQPFATASSHDRNATHPERRSESAMPHNRHPLAGDQEDPADDESLHTIAAAGGQSRTSGVLTQPAALTITGQARDNSLGKQESADEAGESAEDLPPMDKLVFVPNSSFSFQHIDTLRPEDKLTWIEEATEKEIRTQVVRLQKELEVQVALLHRQEAQARTLTSASQREINSLLNQQIQLQRDYLRKLEELNKKLKKTTRRLTTVYI